MYALIKTSDTKTLLGGKRENVGNFNTINDAFSFVRAMEGVTDMFAEIDEENNAGDCLAVFGSMAAVVFVVEPIVS